MSRFGERADREIAHGVKLSAAGAESVWGWATPAGQVRAQRRAAWIAAAAGLAPGMRVLEIGCGTGNFTERFVKHGADLTAIDISPDLLQQASQRRLEGVRFLCLPLEEMPVEPVFDAVIGSSILHHLDVAPSLRRIYQLLKPGGVIAFAEPNMLNPQIAIQKKIPLVKARLGDSPDETAFVRWSLRRLLQAQGFTLVRIQPRDWLHPAVTGAAIPVIVRLESILERLPGVRELAGSVYICARRPVVPSIEG
jgi:2-polyprenyl-3-methyl-5-hydroxy-6-metoxy-1,4-benzoquinol methylase